MTKTKNYNLYITEPSDKPKFKEWRTRIAGNTSDSNMIIIDEKLKELSERKGIASIEQTAGTGEAGSVDTYTITFTDDSTYSFTVRNGSNGSGGENSEYGNTIDTEMSDSSENAVANKVIKAYVDNLFGDVESAVEFINSIIGGTP